MTFPIQCPAIYDRVLPGDLSPQHVRCTYIEGHVESNPRHSWETLKVVDETERTAEVVRAGAVATPALAEVIAQLRTGALDEFVEVLLAEGHDRKRARRGVLGFDTPRRSLS